MTQLEVDCCTFRTSGVLLRWIVFSSAVFTGHTPVLVIRSFTYGTRWASSLGLNLRLCLQVLPQRRNTCRYPTTSHPEWPDQPLMAHTHTNLRKWSCHINNHSCKRNLLTKNPNLISQVSITSLCSRAGRYT